MKKILLLSLMIIGFCSPLFAVDSLSIKLSFIDDYGVSSKDLLFGIHKDATNNVDTALGERMLPEMPPPGDIYVIFFITDSSDMKRYQSYVDFRPIPEETQFLKYYRFKVENLSTSYTISWSKIGNYIDSAFVRDIVNGSYVNVDMKAQESFYVENFGMDQFNIVVYYNKNYVDVNENSNNNVKENVALYPNPVSSELKFFCDGEHKKYKLLNSAGIEILGAETKVQNSIDMTSYSPGLYFLYVEDDNGLITVKKFIKY
ncbi:MAG: T9SS type A sorting domain-containing protein [bacterium]